MKRLKVVIFLLLGFASINLQAQDAVSATGGEATGSGGVVSYTVGQLFYSTHSGGNGSVAEGVQQAYEISDITDPDGTTGIEDRTDLEVSVIAYPNPTNDYLNVKIENETCFSWQMYDRKGVLLMNEKALSNTTSISMQHLVPGTYFLKITKGRNVVKVFKIIKK